MERKNYHDLKTLSSRKKTIHPKRLNLAFLLLLIGLFILFLDTYVDAVLAQQIGEGAIDPGDPGGDVISGVAGGTSDETDVVLGSREGAIDRGVSWVGERWNWAAEFAGWMFIVIALIVGFAFGISVGLSIGGSVGVVMGFVSGGLLAWSTWGIWDQATKGHLIPLVIVGLAAWQSLTGHGWRAEIGIASVMVIYFLIILDPFTLKSGIWDAMNVLRLSGADSYADMFGLDGTPWDYGV